MFQNSNPDRGGLTVTWHWRWHWRSLAAVVYLVICLCDFVIMPLYREYTYTRIPLDQMVNLAMKMDSTNRIDALKIIKEDRTWVPITTDVFHISFGAILGVSALPMNRVPTPTPTPTPDDKDIPKDVPKDDDDTPDVAPDPSKMK